MISELKTVFEHAFLNIKQKEVERIFKELNESVEEKGYLKYEKLRGLR